MLVLDFLVSFLSYGFGKLFFVLCYDRARFALMCERAGEVGGS